MNCWEAAHTNIPTTSIIRPAATHTKILLTIRTDTENKSIQWRGQMEANRQT